MVADFSEAEYTETDSAGGADPFSRRADADRRERRFMRKIILASASPRRKELLERAGVEFEVRPGSGEEIISASVPEEVVKELSAQKARAAVFPAEEGTVILGADTIVSFGGKILGKPSDEEDAVKTLLLLQGNTHQVYTGVTILEYRDGAWREHTFAECTDVAFYPVEEPEIREYVRSGEPMDKAGSYGIQGRFGIYVRGIRGDYTNVVGLPVGRLFYEAKKLGIVLRG